MSADVQVTKDLVIRFYNALMRRDWPVVRALGRPDYIQHNPRFETGIEGVIKGMSALPFPPATTDLEFVRVIAEGDYVMTLRRMTPFTPAPEGAVMANVDIFRVQDGRVAEHWDYQEVFPRGSDPPKNDNGPF